MGVYWGTKRHSWLSYVSFWLSISFFMVFLIEVFILKTLSNSSVQIVKYFYFIFVPVNIFLSLKLLFKKNEKKALPIFSFIVSLLFTILILVLALATTGNSFKESVISHSSFLLLQGNNKWRMDKESISLSLI